MRFERVLASLAALTSLLLAEPSGATAPGGNDGSFVSYEPPPTSRRGGFAMGLTSGLGLMSTQGFPNKVEALSDPNAEVFTGPVLGTSFSLWLGGALRDWLSFGLGVQSSAGFGSGELSSVPAALLHVEAFPLFFKGGHFRDLGVSLDGGLGMGVILDSNAAPGDEPLAVGGSMSFLGASAFYEPLRFWNFSAGPALSYAHAFSQSLSSHQVLLNFRIALYGVQPKNEPKAPQQASHQGSPARPVDPTRGSLVAGSARMCPNL